MLWLNFCIMIINYSLISDDNTNKPNNTRDFKTPILRERWYQIGVLGIHIFNFTKGNAAIFSNYLKSNSSYTLNIIDTPIEPAEETCRLLNQKKSIIDSGTTNIRLPTDIFRQVIYFVHFLFFCFYLVIKKT